MPHAARLSLKPHTANALSRHPISYVSRSSAANVAVHVRSSTYLQKLVISAEHSPSHVRSLTQENGSPLTVSVRRADKNIVNLRAPWPG